MAKLELKHLAPYLPYKLEVVSNERYENEIALITSLNYGLDQDLIMLKSDTEEFDFFEDKLEKVKPLLRQLSDLLNHKDCWNELYEQCSNIDENLDYLPEFSGDLFKTSLSYKAVSILIMWHFDIFGLIKKGLAKNILELDAETPNK